MSKITIGIGGSYATNCREDTIVTYALGSCIALIILDPVSRVGAMAHIALPESHVDLSKAQNLPGYFADTGVPYLLQLMKEKGSKIHPGLIAKLVGGARVMRTEDHFEIGKRNAVAIKRLLWQFNISVKSEDIGGENSRTVHLNMEDGKVYISSHAYEDVRKI